MFDGLRNDPSDSSGFEEPREFFPEDKPEKARPARRKSSKKLLGLTAPQRFVLATMMLIAVCTLGALCLLVFGRFVIPGQ